ncbi:hypothetical protein GCM10009006_37160 [Haloarcula argentinensis]|uniref:Uncharacterized protein n=1 Tax=Haloarcula argentinensis TaxID=43776 RepID=A0A830FS90_HALAR|nr:hypothetical protein GCM10009006_37160 [Haloarcula argentinensis]
MDQFQLEHLSITYLMELLSCCLLQAVVDSTGGGVTVATRIPVHHRPTRSRSSVSVYEVVPLNPNVLGPSFAKYARSTVYSIQVTVSETNTL